VLEGFGPHGQAYRGSSLDGSATGDQSGTSCRYLLGEADSEMSGGLPAVLPVAREMPEREEGCDADGSSGETDPRPRSHDRVRCLQYSTSPGLLAQTLARSATGACNREQGQANLRVDSRGRWGLTRRLSAGQGGMLDSTVSSGAGEPRTGPSRRLRRTAVAGLHGYTLSWTRGLTLWVARWATDSADAGVPIGVVGSRCLRAVRLAPNAGC